MKNFRIRDKVVIYRPKFDYVENCYISGIEYNKAVGLDLFVLSKSDGIFGYCDENGNWYGDKESSIKVRKITPLDEVLE